MKTLLLIALLASPNYRERERASHVLNKAYDTSFITRITCHVAEIKSKDLEQHRRLRQIREKRTIWTCPPLPYLCGCCHFSAFGYDSEGQPLAMPCFMQPFGSGAMPENEEEVVEACAMTRNIYNQLLWFGFPPQLLRSCNDDWLDAYNSAQHNQYYEYSPN